MNGTDYTTPLAQLSVEEGVFTTAQAARFGIPRDVLARACAAGKLERVVHGAYRSAFVTSSQLDEISAAWKSTNPSKMTFERMVRASWDGVAIGGTTATGLNGIGDFYLHPIRIFAPKRINFRNPDVRASVRCIDREDVTFEHGFAVTRMERTLVDLILDDEELSLIEDAYRDALDKGIDFKRLHEIVNSVDRRQKMKIDWARRNGDLYGL